MKSYNSYKRLSKKQTIIEILQHEQRPLSPKEISWISKKDSRFRTLNHSTVRVYLRQLLIRARVSQSIHGYYEVTESTYWVLGGVGAWVRVHDLRLVWSVGVRERMFSFEELIGGVKISCQAGSKRGKVSAIIACDEGIDFQGVCFAVDLIRRVVLEKAGINLDGFECEVCCEFNEDFQSLRLDGVKCVTVKSFLGDLERVYNKPSCLRSEVKINKTDLQSTLALLKGGVSAYNILQSNFILMRKLDRIALLLEQNLKANG